MMPYPGYSFRLHFWSACCYSIGGVLAVVILGVFARRSTWLVLNRRVCDRGLVHFHAIFRLRLDGCAGLGRAVRPKGVWGGANRG